MGSFLALIGSIVIGSMFMLTLFNFYGDLVDHQSNRMQEMWTQEWLASLAEVIDYDFRKMGSSVANPNQAITLYPSVTDITFLADVDNDLVAETVRYQLSGIGAAASTENPRDRILTRTVDGTPELNEVSGVTAFSVRLLDWNGNYTVNRAEAYSVEVSLTVESMIFFGDSTFGRAIWRKRITPENMMRIVSTDIN